MLCVGYARQQFTHFCDFVVRRTDARSLEVPLYAQVYKRTQSVQDRFFKIDADAQAYAKAYELTCDSGHCLSVTRKE